MDLMSFFNALNAVIWHNWVLYAVLVTGVLFTVWSGFCQYRALTHGVAITRGKYDDPGDPGAISHFQALSAALSATVGLGNIGGVALAISLGGPGAVFWMWVVGLSGMAVKMTEVTLTMLYRNTDDPENPHGGPMMVVDQGVPARWPKLRPAGRAFAVIFSISVIISAITGGNLFQAWNVGDVTESYFGVPAWMCGLTLAVATGLVIIGGIRRIGQVASKLVPFMVVLYFLGCIAVLGLSYEQIPESFALIFRGAFSSLEGTGAFLGGTVGYAFIFGMKRALFSSEAGQGSSPIAHSAARTDEPVREGIVAALEPFIDTLVVCTLTALVILSTGQWRRGPEAEFAALPPVVAGEVEGSWTIGETTAPERAGGSWVGGESVFMVAMADYRPETDNNLHKILGEIELAGDGHGHDSVEHRGQYRCPGAAGQCGLFVSLRRRNHDRAGIGFGDSGPGQVAGQSGSVAVCFFHDHFVELLCRTGRLVPWGPQDRAFGLQDQLLRVGAGGHIGLVTHGRGAGYGNHAGHRADAGREHADPVDIRLAGDARLQGVHRPIHQWEDGSWRGRSDAGATDQGLARRTAHFRFLERLARKE